MTIKNVLGMLFTCLLVLGIGGIVAVRRQPLQTYATSTYSTIQSLLRTPSSTDTGNSVTTTSGDSTPATGMVLSGISPSLSTGVAITPPSTGEET